MTQSEDIKEEGDQEEQGGNIFPGEQEENIILNLRPDLMTDNYDDLTEELSDDEDPYYNDVPLDDAPRNQELEKLPRPCSALNCRQARTYLVKLLRAANGGMNPQYGNPSSKPEFWPDHYWPWEQLTDVHTKPRGMEEPLQYSEMMKLAIDAGYRYFGKDPETYWDRTVEESEPIPVVRGTPAPILEHQMENLGEPPRLPRPNHMLNCVQARTVLSKLLRYQQAGNNPVYGHPETRPPWWPDECIRWADMVDLRGRPPYLPREMTYTDVLKLAIERGLRYFGYDAETWIDSAQYTREMNVSLLSKLNKTSQTSVLEEVPRLPIPVNKMNCSVARTSLARLLRFHCGANPKYGSSETMPAWWPNDVFEWVALKNLSHRFEGYMADSYSNCLRLALSKGYIYYKKDPNTYVEDPAEGLPIVSNKRLPSILNPQVNQLIRRLEPVAPGGDFEMDPFSPDQLQLNLPSTSSSVRNARRIRDLPPLIPINKVVNYIKSSTFRKTPMAAQPAENYQTVQITPFDMDANNMTTLTTTDGNSIKLYQPSVVVYRLSDSGFAQCADGTVLHDGAVKQEGGLRGYNPASPPASMSAVVDDSQTDRYSNSSPSQSVDFEMDDITESDVILIDQQQYEDDNLVIDENPANEESFNHRVQDENRPSGSGIRKTQRVPKASLKFSQEVCACSLWKSLVYVSLTLILYRTQFEDFMSLHLPYYLAAVGFLIWASQHL